MNTWYWYIILLMSLKQWYFKGSSLVWVHKLLIFVVNFIYLSSTAGDWGVTPLLFLVWHYFRRLINYRNNFTYQRLLSSMRRIKIFLHWFYYIHHICFILTPRWLTCWCITYCCSVSWGWYCCIASLLLQWLFPKWSVNFDWGESSFDSCG